MKEIIINVPEDKRKLKVGMIGDWTLTAIELWDDKEFLEKRYEEQLQYLRELRKRDLSRKRFDELRESAMEVGMRIVNRLHELEAK